MTRSLSTLFCHYFWKNKQSTCLIDYKDVQNTCENLEHCRLHVENLRYKKSSRCIAKSVNLLSNCLTKVKMIFFGSIHSIIKLYRKRYQSTSLIIEIFSKHLSINLPQFCRCHYTSQNFIISSNVSHWLLKIKCNCIKHVNILFIFDIAIQLLILNS